MCVCVCVCVCECVCVRLCVVRVSVCVGGGRETRLLLSLILFPSFSLLSKCQMNIIIALLGVGKGWELWVGGGREEEEGLV